MSEQYCIHYLHECLVLHEFLCSSVQQTHMRITSLHSLYIRKFFLTLQYHPSLYHHLPVLFLC